MPDTFHSWFVITAIHVHLLMARLMAEGEEGRMVRNAVVDAMWKDVDFKAKQLGVYAFSFNYVIYNNLLIYRIVIKFIGYSDQCPKQKHSKPCRRVPSSSFRV